MKKLVSYLLCALLLCMAASALAEAPAEGSMKFALENVRGNTSFTADSYPEAWITPVYAQYIIAQRDAEKHPSRYLNFPAPENTAAMSFDYDEAAFVNHDKLLVYNYFAYDRASFELFLEKAEEEHTLADGSDGVAMFVQPDSRRARAMINLKEHFGGTAKLEIIIDDYTRDITGDELAELIKAEAARVESEMQVVDLPQYWSANAIAQVELWASSDPVKALVDTQGLTVTDLDSDGLVYQVKEGDGTRATEITIATHSYPMSKEESTDETLADGVAYKCYATDYTGYASFLLLEEGKYGSPIYLNIEISCTPEEFPALVEAAYARVTIEK